MKKSLSAGLICASLFVFGQNCAAFSEGCWNLVSASNGVEIYVTHKFTKIPESNNYNLIVYSKAVNTVNGRMASSQNPSIGFTYYPVRADIPNQNTIGAPSVLTPRQIIISRQILQAKNAEIIYDQFSKDNFILSN